MHRIKVLRRAARQIALAFIAGGDRLNQGPALFAVFFDINLVMDVVSRHYALTCRQGAAL